MSEPIKAGDLVMAVRGHSCVISKIGGIPFTVARIVRQVDGGWWCPICGERDIGKEQLYGANLRPLHTDDHSAIPLGWLKKIPPLGELGDVRQDEEIHA